MAGAFLTADFNLGYLGSSTQNFMTHSNPGVKHDPLPVANRSLRIAVESEDGAARALAVALREKLLKESVFETIEIGGDEPPVLRVRVDSNSWWFAGFATGQIQAEFMFMSHRNDFDPRIQPLSIRDLESTPEKIEAVAFGRVSAAVDHYGLVSLPRWWRLSTSSLAHDIADELARQHRQMRGLP
ncbi:MAG: hypothetical protein JNL28_06425 [Planctomycetes bacterium]|nr:hypothetical protein [Planctomycetota bacterium]